MYLTLEEYRNSGNNADLSDKELNALIEKAEDNIDTLTFCRINHIGFENLTAFQQKLIKKAICIQTDFLHDYGEILNNPFVSYSINGVSMSFDKSMYMELSGIKIPDSCYSLLMQTGLTYQGVK